MANTDRHLTAYLADHIDAQQIPQEAQVSIDVPCSSVTIYLWYTHTHSCILVVCNQVIPKTCEIQKGAESGEEELEMMKSKDSKALCEPARSRYYLKIVNHIRYDPYTLKKSALVRTRFV